MSQRSERIIRDCRFWQNKNNHIACILQSQHPFCLGVGMWMIAFLWCMNVTPLYAAPTTQPTQPVSRPVKRKVIGSLKPTKKTLARKVTSRKPAVRQVDCKGRMRYGKFCLGRVIGPRFSSQILRCPHCGKDVHVKRLDKPWQPANYDSDLRPYFGHFRQKHRIWVC